MDIDRRITFERILGVAGLCMALIACGSDSPGPNGTEGAFVLHELNGQPLPYDHEGLGCCTYLSGMVELDRGRYAATLTARNRNTTVVFTASEWGTYTEDASSLTFSLDSFAVAPLGFDRGTLSADTLRLAFGGEGPGSPDQFHGLYLRDS
jgi:hypothetical protein